MKTATVTKRFFTGHSVLLAWAILMAPLALTSPALAENRHRTELPFPDLPGLVTLRCDFHMHTVFSDGAVWPTVRVEEAWRDGLDAIALTDHIEYQRYKEDIPVKYGRSADVARADAASLGMIVIRSAEITRGEPPGHLNALFLTNVGALNEKDYRVEIKKAFEQGAFLFWNHPGWKQPDQKSVWYAEQGEFYTNGWLQGIEIVNGPDYDPIAHQWCLDKRLTMIGGSDVHGPIGFEYRGPPDDIRPMTLVFAKARSAEAIREALAARRTAVLSQGRLIGEPEYLEPLFLGAIEIINSEIRLRGKEVALIQIRNKAAMNFELHLSSKLPELEVQEKVILAAGKVSLIRVRGVSDRVTGERQVGLPCRVLNLLAAPHQGLKTLLPVKVEVEPGK
jgi:3',5'-nucleoside bisphosphate phosphatase